MTHHHDRIKCLMPAELEALLLVVTAVALSVIVSSSCTKPCLLYADPATNMA